MNSQKGITLMSLMIYVVAFLTVTGIIGAVTTFFYSNYSMLDEKSSVSAEYNKLNLIFAEESAKKNNTVYSMKSNIAGEKAERFAEPSESLEYESKYDLLKDIKFRCEGHEANYLDPQDFKPFFDTYVLFSDENFIGWRKDQKVIYYNQSIICEDVEDFIINKSVLNDKEILSVYVQFGSKSFSTKYTF